MPLCFVLVGTHHDNSVTTAIMDTLCRKTAEITGVEYTVRHHKLLADEIGNAGYYAQSCASVRHAHILSREYGWALKIYHGCGTAHQRWDTASLVLTCRDTKLLADFLAILVKETAPDQVIQLLAQPNGFEAHEELAKKMAAPLEWMQFDEGVLVPSFFHTWNLWEAKYLRRAQ